MRQVLPVIVVARARCYHLLSTELLLLHFDRVLGAFGDSESVRSRLESDVSSCLSRCRLDAFSAEVDVLGHVVVAWAQFVSQVLSLPLICESFHRRPKELKPLGFGLWTEITLVCFKVLTRAWGGVIIVTFKKVLNTWCSVGRLSCSCDCLVFTFWDVFPRQYLHSAFAHN